jgi:hypothetical protein
MRAIVEGRGSGGPIFNCDIRHFDICFVNGLALYADHMSRWVALLVLVASCAKGGVELVIEPSDHMTKVVLYVGVGDALVESIQPAMHAKPMPLSAWERDRYNELDERDVVAGEPVVFQFQGSQTLGVVIAVGFADGRPIAATAKRSIEVPDDHVARYTLALEPISDGTNTSPLSLSIWQSQAGSPKAGKTCVALYDERHMSGDAVVTAGDPDCDGWPTGDDKECQPNYYMSFTRPRLQDVSCLVTERVVTSEGIRDGCVLGGPPCRDGTGAESGCTAPSVYCLPKSVCNRCTLTANDYDCARDISPLVAQYPTHLHCKLYFDEQGKLCTNTFKALSNPGTDVAGQKCKTGDDNGFITTVGQGWDKRIDYKTNAAALRVEIANLQSNCNFDISVSGGFEQRQEFAALVAGQLENGRGVAIPIRFEADPTVNLGCANQVACQGSWSWDLTELVDQCLNTPVFPP